MGRFNIYTLIEKHFDYIFGNIFVELNKQLKSCRFLTDFFEKVLYLAELQAKKYYGIKLLQSIMIHPVKHLAMYFVGFLYLATILHPHREVIPALLTNLKAIK